MSREKPDRSAPTARAIAAAASIASAYGVKDSLSDAGKCGRCAGAFTFCTNRCSAQSLS